jgi:alkane 1-monooxygenase
MKDFKYLFAFLLPLSALISLWERGWWSWATVILAFGLLPALEMLLPASARNIPEEEEASRSQRRWFDLLLYLNLPLVFLIVGWYLLTVTGQALTAAELAGLTLGAGIVLGANGINVAHELGHRPTRGEQAMSKLLLLPALYQHFFIEHNRGHHKYVATRQDPATARRGEPIYRFWPRAIGGAWRAAWSLERERLDRLGQKPFSWQNQMLRFQVYQLGWLAGITAWLGWDGLLAALAVAVVGMLLLETINYIEHYGLQRRLLPSGRPEPVAPAHSWNSDHELGRIFLYELTRHSDHHFKATRKYQILRHLDQSPQLPFGYPTCMVIAMVPPLWFRMMNPRIEMRSER